MDYITIIATRQLLLFVPPREEGCEDTILTPTNIRQPVPLPWIPIKQRSASQRSNSRDYNGNTNLNGSTSTRPSPSTLRISSPFHTPREKLTPKPVSMPLNSMMTSDTDCAFYLIHQHLLPSFEGQVTKRILEEAEVLAWKEIDKSKMFARGLGEWFGKYMRGIRESELRDLADRFGVGVVPPDASEGRNGKERELDRQNNDELHEEELGFADDREESGEQWREERNKGDGDGVFALGEEEIGFHSPASSGGATLSDAEGVLT